MRRYRMVIILLLLFAVPLGGAMVAARFLLPGAPAESAQAKAKPAPPPVKKEKTRKIVAAARELRIGTLLGHDDLTGIDISEEEVRRAYVVMQDSKTIDSLRGHAVRETIAAGHPLTRSAVVGPGQRGFLAAVLTPGTRAATIQLGAATSQAGLIDPGDRVDVILTAKLRLGGRADSVFTRTILQDVRVVAVDRKIDVGAAAEPSGQEGKRAKIVTATLEVSPAQAGLLALGDHEGTLSLVVRPLAAATGPRSPADAVDLRKLLDVPEPEEPAQSVEPAPVATPASETRQTVLMPRRAVRIIRGSEVSEEVFSDESGDPSDGSATAAAPGDASPPQSRN